MNMHKIIVSVLSLFLCTWAAAQEVKVKGVVTDAQNETLPGVSVYPKKDPGKGLSTNMDGAYEITVPPNSVLVFSYLGYRTQEIDVSSAAGQVINVVLDESAHQLEEVSVVGYGRQRKVSVVGAISSVKPAELQTGGVTSVSNNLAGRIAGLIGVQSSGEPGQNISEFWIRGISTFGGGSSALVLIDGMDRGASSLNDLAPEDIESFSVLKDATATAIYGARGANGVILINTKRGEEGKMSISANLKYSIETLPRLPEYLQAYDYATLANEASVGRGNSPVYSPEKFDIIKYGMDPDLFPDVNWQDEILRDHVFATQANVSITGGSKTARYYMSGFYRENDAIYKQEGMKRYNSDVKRRQYSFRSNLDVDVTKNTKVSLLLAAKLVDQNRPGDGNTDYIWEAVTNVTPMTVPLIYSNGQLPSYGTDDKMSPTVRLNDRGFMTTRDNSMESQLVLEQDLGMFLKGLKVTGTLSFDNFNNHVTRRFKEPDLWYASDRDWRTGALLTARTVTGSDVEFSSSSYGTRKIYGEFKANYEQVFNQIHRAGAMLLYQQNDFQDTRISDKYKDDQGKLLLYSIPKRTQGIAARFTYSLKDIYFVEGNFGYNGSENFPKNQRFGFFPSVALGYVVSNYQAVQDRFPFLDMLKLRYSLGLVGNDQIKKKDEEIRFPYLDTVNSTAPGYSFGDAPVYEAGISDAQLGSTGLVWESAVKQNFGIDVQLWNSINLTVDGFLDRRDNIFMLREGIPGTVGVTNDLYGNVGKMRSWGSDGTLSWMRKFGDFMVELRGNYTFTRDKILAYDETPRPYPYLLQKGTPYDITRGLIALGLFKDEEDVRNSPTQFGEVLPGDIKYQDVNGDGVINDDDKVPIGNARVPKVQYGFAASVAWKGFDFSIFFRGAGKSDYFMGGAGYYPFEGQRTGNVLSIVNDPANRWIPMSYALANGIDPALAENPNARFPRLTYGNNVNNNRESTFWLADASYLRLKNLEIGYTIPKKLAQKMFMSSLRASIVGDNLLLWDKVKLFDPEQADKNGSKYPLTRSWTFVLQLSF
jgi:TonB-linked SusC/RagA family outer membrane protein